MLTRPLIRWVRIGEGVVKCLHNITTSGRYANGVKPGSERTALIIMQSQVFSRLDPLKMEPEMVRHKIASIRERSCVARFRQNMCGPYQSSKTDVVQRSLGIIGFWSSVSKSSKCGTTWNGGSDQPITELCFPAASKTPQSFGHFYCPLKAY